MHAVRLYIRRGLIAVIALGFVSICLRDSHAQDELPDLVRRIKPAAVAIETFDARGEKLSRGSGFFIDKDRVVTNRHVIDGAYRAEVHLNSGNSFAVKSVVALDAELVAPGHDPRLGEGRLDQAQVLVQWADEAHHEVVGDGDGDRGWWHVAFGDPGYRSPASRAAIRTGARPGRAGAGGGRCSVRRRQR